MKNIRLVLGGACAVLLVAFAQCSSPSTTSSEPPPPGGPGGALIAGTTGSAGSTLTGGTTGGAGSGAGGMTGAGAGGSGHVGGTTGTAGANGTAGAAGTGGSSGSGGTPGTGGRVVDGAGVPLAKPGDQTSTSRQYLNLGDMRLINNRWGSDARNCTGTMQSVFINTDGTLGWNFNRPTCGGAKGDPDFPEVEFGIAPFGTTSTLLTTPAFSSTTLLPIQLKDLTSASVSIDTFTTTFQKPTYWDSNVEFWISKLNPATNANAGVYAEVIAFLGYESGRTSTSAGGWSCDKTGSVTSAGIGYTLCHQSDTWSSGWRFFNFNLNAGPVNTFGGNFDVKAFIDWVSQNYPGFTTDMWLTRIEVGTEIDDNTQGSAKINNLTFEINGTSRSVQLAH